MQRIAIGVSRLRRYSSDVSFEVLGDLGSGELDAAHPLTAGPVRLWPDAAPRAGHLLDGHLMAPHSDSVDPDGHLEAGHVMGEHLWPAIATVFESPGYVFGRFGHGVRMRDGVGNESGVAESAVTVNSSPRAPRFVTRVGNEEGSDQVVFEFEPVRFEPVG